MINRGKQGLAITPEGNVALHNLNYPGTWYLNKGINTGRTQRGSHPSLLREAGLDDAAIVRLVEQGVISAEPAAAEAIG